MNEENFAAHDAYDREGEGFSLSTIPFDARVTEMGSNHELRITVPTLDGATEETVEPVVEDGWFETFCLRVADAPGATRASVPEPTVERSGDTVEIAFELAGSDPAEAAKVLAEFVEGTYVEGVVPGYTYRPPVAGLLSRARTQGTSGGGEGSTGDAESGPTPR